MKKLLTHIIQNTSLHAQWLNTLSYLENCGARKIARCQHPTLVQEEMLKHAAEEFRHAYHLKRQIDKIASPLPDYTSILGGKATLHYLNALDVQTCRFLPKAHLKYAAYLLVTYAIELRASALYPLYHDLLKQHQSPVTVKCILLEEEEHLNEMRSQLALLPNHQTYVEKTIALETVLYNQWILKLTDSVFSL